MTASIKHLQSLIDQLEKQRADDQKWIHDNARRLDEVEAKMRDEATKVIDYVREAIQALNMTLRTELDVKVPELLTTLKKEIT